MEGAGDGAVDDCAEAVDREPVLPPAHQRIRAALRAPEPHRRPGAERPGGERAVPRHRVGHHRPAAGECHVRDPVRCQPSPGDALHRLVHHAGRRATGREHLERGGRMKRLLLAACLAGLPGCCTKYLAFGTATKFGLDISQKADQTVDVSMGYDRVEIASIPAPEQDAKESEDTYSVLGTLFIGYGNPWTDEPFHLNQFFATGWGARKAAGSEAFRSFFGRKAAQIEQK